MDNNQNHSELQKPAKKRPSRRRRRTLQRASVLLVSVLIILGVAWTLSHFIERASLSTLATSFSLSPQDISGASTPAALPGNTASDSWDSLVPVPKTINAVGMVAPDYRMICLPENGRVDMQYFDTVTFVGDSITQGMQMYPQDGIPNAHYCAYKSISPRGVYDGSIQRRLDGEQEIPMEALVASAPDNVYILLGTNAMVGIESDEVLLGYYKEMLDAMRANLLPGVHYYIQSVTPIRPDATHGYLSNERIIGFNNQLARLAYQEGCYFLDLHEALAGDDGYLREDFASARDGYHLTPSGYAAWKEYLVTHTAYSPKNPYIEGSPYSQAPAPEG